MLSLSLQMGEAFVRRFSQILYRCFEEIGSGKAALYMRGSEVVPFYLISNYGWPRTSIPPEELSLEDPLVVWAGRQRRSFVVNQSGPVAELAKFSLETEALRFLITPFFDRGEWVGLLIQKDRTRGLPYDLEGDEGRTLVICQEVIETMRDARVVRSVSPLPMAENRVALEVPVPPSSAMVAADAPAQAMSSELLEGFQPGTGEDRSFAPVVGASVLPDAPADIALAMHRSNRPGVFMPEQRTFFWEAAKLLCNLVPMGAVALWMDEPEEARPILAYSQQPLSPDLKQQVLAHFTYHVPNASEPDLRILTKVEFLENEPLTGIFQTYLPVVLTAEDDEQDLLLLFRNEDRPFTEEEQTSIQMVCRLVGFHLQEIRLHERYHRAFLSVSHKLLASTEGGAPMLQDHSRATAKLAQDFAVHLELSAVDVEAICIASILHDVGTFLLDPNLLTKTGPTDEEMGRIRTHPMLASTFLQDFRFPFDVLGIIRHHHERWDGKGYPDGLRGELIPLGSRIINLIEAFEVMSEGSAFRGPRPASEILSELRRGAGGQFDPMLTVEFLDFLQARGYR